MNGADLTPPSGATAGYFLVDQPVDGVAQRSTAVCTHTDRHFGVVVSPHLNVFGMLDVDRAPGEDPRWRRSEVPDLGIETMSLLLRGDGARHCASRGTREAACVSSESLQAGN